MKVESIKYMIMAQDMERAVAFYRKVFGLTVDFGSEHWTEMQHGGAVVALHGGGDGRPNRTGLSIGVDNITAAVGLAREHGATVVREPEDRPGEPIFLADLRDPEGNEISITQYKG